MPAAVEDIQPESRDAATGCGKIVDQNDRLNEMIFHQQILA
jgi:hypothetical protein